MSAATERPIHATDLPHKVGAEAAPHTNTVEVVIDPADGGHSKLVLICAVRDISEGAKQCPSGQAEPAGAVDDRHSIRIVDQANEAREGDVLALADQ